MNRWYDLLAYRGAGRFGLDNQSFKSRDRSQAFCIELTFAKGTEAPSRLFRALAELIEAFHELDKAFVRSIDVKIEPLVLLEDVETGSLKNWLRNVIESIPDEGLRDLDVRGIIGNYLVKAKYKVLSFISNRDTITSKEEIDLLVEELRDLAEETNVKTFPHYEPIPPHLLLRGLRGVAQPLVYLREEEKVLYIIPGSKVEINKRFSITPEAIDELLTARELESRIEMILKIKKPDYLGDSMWDFRFEGRVVQAKILDKDWLRDFQSRKIDVRPGDSIRALVEMKVRYDEFGEVISTSYAVIKVYEVIEYRPVKQGRLLDTENSEKETKLSSRKIRVRRERKNSSNED